MRRPLRSSVLRQFHSAVLRQFHSAVLRQSHSAVLRQFHSAVLRQSHSAVLRQFHSAVLRQSHSAVLRQFHSAVLRQSHSAVLRQFHSRQMPAAPSYLDIGLALQRLHPDGRTEPLADTIVANAVQRDQHMEVALPSGTYLIMPTTSGALPASRKGPDAAAAREAARELGQGVKVYASAADLPHALRLAFAQVASCDSTM